jgi:ABC-type Fe3+ transport system permease subunit
MVIPHALIASVVEAVVTALVVAYLMRANKPALEIVNKSQIPSETNNFGKWRTLWIGLGTLIIISPIGLLAPGTAWGEWGAEELTSLGLSFIPKGLEKLSGFWAAPIPDYDVPAIGNTNVAYILSAIVGIFIAIGIVWLFTRLVTTGKNVVIESSDCK